MNAVTANLCKGILADADSHVVSGSRDGTLYGAKVGLFAAPFAPGLNSQVADLVEPTYPGYARVPLTWTAPYQQPDFTVAISGGLSLFQMTDDTVPTTVYGAFVVDGTMSPKLLWAEVFSSPIGLTNALQALLYAPQLALGGLNYGSGALVT